MDNQDQTTQDTTAQDTPAQPTLSIVDLQNLRAIVDVASRRGAFQANELSSVGTAYDKLNAFLTAVAPAQTADAPATDAATDAPADTSTDAPAAE